MASQFENISSDLLWECVRGNNAFLVKRRQAGGVQFSRDFLNLTNKHSRKYEGFINERAIGLQPSPSGSMTLTTKIAKNANRPAKAFQTATFSAATPARKAYRGIVNSTAKKGYRADLRAEAVARASAVKLSLRKKRESPKAKLRGRKRVEAEGKKGGALGEVLI
ncbi:hypothetical protein LTR50_005738 [Elasticomyces elasticus]|nr:hypothetical protein LTR50_005738 [Elasticomyces elasticus]